MSRSFEASVLENVKLGMSARRLGLAVVNLHSERLYAFHALKSLSDI